MATYGKQKRNIFPAFSVFQDEALDHDSAWKKNSVKGIKARSRLHYEALNDDESINEAEGAALLDTVPQHQADGPPWTDHQPLRNHLRASRQASKSALSSHQHRFLPLLPLQEVNDMSSEKARRVLGEKTVNAMIKNSNIQAPQESHQVESVNALATQLAFRSTHQSGVPDFTKIDASSTRPGKVSSPIARLLQQVALQEAESRNKETILAELNTRSSPLQRGRRVFNKAAHSIRDRLKSEPKSASPGLGRLTPIGSGNSESDYQPLQLDLDPDRNTRIEQRRAMNTAMETDNPENSRSPLPVYESMRTRMLHCANQSDPFSDDSKICPLPSSSGIALDISFDGPISSPHQFGSGRKTRKVYGRHAEPRSRRSALRTPSSPHRSGLAQHSETMYFTVSPVAQSTPFGLVYNHATASSKPFQAETNSDVPVLDFSFEEMTDEEGTTYHSAASKKVSIGSRSAKRKAFNALPQSPTPTGKKLKHDADHEDTEPSMLVDSMEGLGTCEDIDGPNADGLTAEMSASSHEHEDKRGLSIFDLGQNKGKEKAIDHGNWLERVVKKDRTIKFAHKRSSISEPISAQAHLGPYGSGQQLGMPDDAMDLDELA